ncbi:hypothetical protein [Priestia megaterium]|uniref:hypothetical protein n=1 Tax=Priestia megaterium TaxID=1404 RepID=UPI0020D27C22|nr:hypothetical protein [Priestia megaterium]
MKEILELTQSKRLAEIAKEHLDIGEKKAVAGLKKAGCFNISGKRGWYFEGDKSVLEKSIYDFVSPSKRGKKPVANSAEKEVSATIETPTAKLNPNSQLYVKTASKQENKPTNKQISKQVGKPINQPTKNTTSKPTMKKVTYEIEEQFHDELKIKAIREKRTVSEIVNEIIKEALKK